MSGGLSLWWKNEIHIRILAANHNLIDCDIQIKQQTGLMWVTWVYAGPPKTPPLELTTKSWWRAFDLMDVPW